MDVTDRLQVQAHMEAIESNNRNLIQSINKQISINQAQKDNLQMISGRTNQLTAMIHEVGRNLSYVEQNIVNLQMLQQIEHLQDEVEKILDNIQSAQLGLMSRNILTRTEINKLSISSSELQHLKIDVFCISKQYFLLCDYRISNCHSQHTSLKKKEKKTRPKKI
ncbi:unnamed protein product [Hermetia illucens]|uniref:Uncharacterized protein n=1 Tax=Hermetia illucens TaxID=343691 RepID=A0A7R8V3Z8_HERIL|nr:unnamed protein product [Hermetia illucens]